MMVVSPVSDSTLKKLLTELHTIAVVGISTNPNKDSHMVAVYLKEHGYRVIPVNPGADEILGEKCYPDLLSVSEPVDIVDVFRRPEFLPEIAEQAVAIHAKVLWMQKGISNEEAAQIARQGGLTVIKDT
jgi:predicted CoA-binding protein